MHSDVGVMVARRRVKFWRRACGEDGTPWYSSVLVSVQRKKISDLLLEKVWADTICDGATVHVSRCTRGAVLGRTMPGTTDFVLYEVSEPKQRVIERVQSKVFRLVVRLEHNVEIADSGASGI